MTRLSLVALLAVPWLLLTGLVFGDAVADLEKKGRPSIDAQIAKSRTCTKDKLQVRREWGDISAAEKKAYIAAVLCTMEKPSKLDQTRYPGAKTRYDDFVAVHMNQTLNIHGTGSFLSWHRFYTWSFERVLREECGYTGTQPYWNWGRWAADPEKSPIFDGSDTSMSGNGKKIQHRASAFAPAGNGGGCVETGPFKNMTVRLGPVSPAVDPAPPRNPRADGYGDNPRCLRRDISNYLSSRYTRTEDIVSLITTSRDIATFQNVMQGGGFGFGGAAGGIGVHAGGHFTIAGDPAGDFYTSPNDPAFWLHHAMIDRTWTIWQSQDLAARTNVIAGGTSMMGFGGRMQSLDDLVDLGVVGDKVYKIRDLVSVVDGPFCYVYE
ncbi:Di-copper centre-containing protein [Canariomyces notabilis]|uniref:Di-copper centre-containing protein n=1 Tax=Canariomyces notabilis TaxID=2074819 RepID=A0AAN6YYV2_9PEZI|nr:Di-copper centre-containing protein [Canariomyces arenarius]